MIPKTLAIDFGTKRIGLAVSYWTLAEPLTVLDNNDTVFNEIATIIEEEGIEQIVVGLSEHNMEELSLEFAAGLRQVTKLPILFADETLSSHDAELRLRNPAVKKSTRSGKIDHYAAAHFLQDWLDEQESIPQV